MTVETYVAYLLTVAVFFATPPDTSQLLIISNSINHGLNRSTNTIAGDLLANAIQIAAAGLGLAAIVAASTYTFTVIKWLGVAYLVWTGVKILKSESTSFSSNDVSSKTSSWTLFRQGFFTSLSNPFAIVFFGALFPQFIEPDHSLPLQILILGGAYLIIDGLILVTWGWLGIRAANVLRRYSSRLVNRCCGLVMIFAAALLASKSASGF
ncbi:LysE family translocator [Chromohalobacter israelensis]|uniref:Lysine exporter protein (LYSE/YGGA) n=1 Tax=Chromohalobacter israelensis (strain ATCC BAA-138 / DSM 3043 / CIP 106854 / NCIMB 13768 / 1H11) TaxID=290398 RepID=Q1QZK9_CHRI1|nr:LysE family translocator [Chromohalobacter salexigens]ABE58099.1 Lysine exporter protein (LYSE/YGGA) [Chromohalobacter salexigens DSM 3043]